MPSAPGFPARLYTSFTGAFYLWTPIAVSTGTQLAAFAWLLLGGAAFAVQAWRLAHAATCAGRT
ncbi:MAG: hypothetical protein R2712_01580 [Vicinamibacterales bacterium]